MSRTRYKNNMDDWLTDVVRAQLRRTEARPVVVGVQGVQGCGKTTLCAAVARRQPSWLALSLDDFYLDAIPHHPDPRLCGRGNPGTHDLALLLDCLDRLASHDLPIDLPVYDKALRDGHGGRSANTRRVDRRPEVVLLEGWCLGFRALGRADDAVDAHVAEYERRLLPRLHTLVVLRADASMIRRWRVHDTPADVDAFLDRFEYGAYLAALHDEEGHRRVDLDAHRRLAHPTLPTTCAIYLTKAQRAHLLRRLEATASAAAHTHVWSRRSYAAQAILRDPELRPVRRYLATRFPEYVIAFDVLFESKGGATDWHCDYESLGPFAVPDRWTASRDRHFVSVHFTLTPDGGVLQTLDDWPFLSYVHYWCIATFGIFSWAHTLLVALSRPLFALLAASRTSDVGVGNVFDNTRLHAVTAGAPRVSYVVRLVKRGAVRVTRDSIREGVRRSAACAVFARLGDVDDADVADVPWEALAE